MTEPRAHSVNTRHVEGVALSEFTFPDSTKPQIVFVHGGCHGSWQWAKAQQTFAEFGRSSTAFDWRNHGESQGLPNREWLDRGIPAVTEEIGIVVETLSSEPVLVAHSMGGLAAAIYAADNPGKIRGLVLLMPVVPAAFAGEGLPIDVDFDSPWGPPPSDIARQMFYSGVKDDEEAASIYSRLQAESPRAVWEATRCTVEVDVDAIRVPVLVLAGDHDEVTRPEPIAAMAQAIGATFMTVEGCGHGVTFDPRWPSLLMQIESWMATEVDQHTVRS